MNTYNINDEAFINSQLYKDFIAANPGNANLKIRAYAANQAIPISGLKVVVSKVIDNNNVIFFEGETNTSGVIERIVLPTPSLNPSNLTEPNSIIYDIETTYVPDNVKGLYKITMYENICVVQNVNIVPNTNMKMGGI